MKLPVVSGAEAAKAFRKIGYEFDEQHGSHMILRCTAPPHRRLSVPNHKEPAQGLFANGSERPGLSGRWIVRIAYDATGRQDHRGSA